jgi:hypothetical protein
VIRSAISIAAAFAVTGLAHAAPFDDFQQLCVRTSSGASEALAAADAKGWSPAPESLVEQWRSDPTLATPQGRIKAATGVTLVLLTGDSTEGDGATTLHIHNCSVMAFPGDTAFAAQAVQWGGVPSTMSDHRTTVYPFVLENERHQPIAESDPAMLPTLIAQHRVNMLFVQDGADMTVISLGVPWKIGRP